MSFRDFKKAPNNLIFRDIGYLILAGMTIILVASVLAVANYYLAVNLPDGGEFYLLRVGGRAFLFDHIEPYSGTVPTIVQEWVYKRSATPGEDAYILDIPFHLMLFFFPLALFPEALVARAFWMVLTQIALFGMIFLNFRLLHRQVPRALRVIIFIACFTSLYSYQSLLEGSPVIVLCLVYIGIWFALRARADELAGMLIVFSSFQWEMSGPFLLFTVMWVIWERRWRVFSGAGMLAFILFVITLFIYPGWILPFLRAAWNSLRMGFGFSLHQILDGLWPEYGSTLGWVLTAVLFVVLGYEWGAARGANFRRVLWVILLTIAATPLLGQRMEMDQLVFLTLPVMMVVMIAHERWRKLGNSFSFLLTLFFFGIPWLIYVKGLPFDVNLSANEVLFLFWPVFTFVGLYWLRWWMLRPPRTWVDSITQRNQ